MFIFWLRYLLSILSPRSLRIYFYWICRGQEEFDWFCDLLSDAAEGPATEDQEDAGCDEDGPEAHGLENNEEEERHEDDPDYSAEEEFVHEEHS